MLRVGGQKEITYRDVMVNELGVMDQTAITLCKENKLPIIVLNIHRHGEVAKALLALTMILLAAVYQPGPKLPRFLADLLHSKGYTIYGLLKGQNNPRTVFGVLEERFEEVAHLLWIGHLPNRTELDELHAKLEANRALPAAVMTVFGVRGYQQANAGGHQEGLPGAFFTGVLATLGLVSLVSAFAAGDDKGPGALFGLFLFGVIVAPWLANYMIMQRPGRR